MNNTKITLSVNVINADTLMQLLDFITDDPTRQVDSIPIDTIRRLIKDETLSISSTVIVSSQEAALAVFADSYQEAMTERLREALGGRLVRTLAPTITQTDEVFT